MIEDNDEVEKSLMEGGPSLEHTVKMKLTWDDDGER